MKTLAQKLLVISSYPEKGLIHGKQTVGVASYAKNTLLGIKNAADIEITVLAEKLHTRHSGNPQNPKHSGSWSSQDDNNTYTDSGITVKRTWQRNSFSAFWNLLKEIYTNYKTTKSVLIEFELAMFGELLYILPFPLFLLVLNILGKEVTVVCHQVVPDLSEMHGHINLEKDSLKFPLFNLGIRLFYRSLLLLASQVIVFDEVLKDKLKPYGNTRKITVIPHGVEEFKTVTSKLDARERINKLNPSPFPLTPNSFVVLCFGYLAWYKGTDWIVDALASVKEENSQKNLVLVLAGGPNPNHEQKEFYQKYIDSITKKCAELGFIITGYVQEKDIPFYFQASDLVLFPYRVMMSSSGPLSMALSFKKPFMVSDTMRGIFKTQDASSLLEKHRLSKDDICFTMNTDFKNSFLSYQRRKALIARITSFAADLSSARSWKHIGEYYVQALFS